MRRPRGCQAAGSLCVWRAQPTAPLSTYCSAAPWSSAVPPHSFRTAHPKRRGRVGSLSHPRAALPPFPSAACLSCWHGFKRGGALRARWLRCRYSSATRRHVTPRLLSHVAGSSGLAAALFTEPSPQPPRSRAIQAPRWRRATPPPAAAAAASRRASADVNKYSKQIDAVGPARRAALAGPARVLQLRRHGRAGGGWGGVGGTKGGRASRLWGERNARESGDATEREKLSGRRRSCKQRRSTVPTTSSRRHRRRRRGDARGPPRTMRRR